MSLRYKVRPNVGVLVLPEIGKVEPGAILVGAKFARYAPQFLELMLEGASAPIDVSVVAPVAKAAVQTASGKVIPGPAPIEGAVSVSESSPVEPVVNVSPVVAITEATAPVSVEVAAAPEAEKSSSETTPAPKKRGRPRKVKTT